MSNDIPTPELDKRSKILDKSQVIGEFIDWLREVKGWDIYGPTIETTFWAGQYEIVELARKPRGGGGTVLTSYAVKDSEAIWGTYIEDGPFDTREQAQAWIDGEERRRQRVAEENPVWRAQYFQPEELLAEFFGIDLGKVEQERRAILEALRS